MSCDLYARTGIVPKINFGTPPLSNLPPRWTPKKVEAAVVAWLRLHFSLESNIQEEALIRRVWTEEDSTGILIESASAWKPRTTEKRPAIYVKRHKAIPAIMGIGNNRLMMGCGPDKANYRSTLLTMNVSCFCVAGESAETELLGSEVYDELDGFANQAAQALCLHRFRVVELGDLAKLEEATENFVVPVVAEIQYWKTRKVIDYSAAQLSRVTLVLNG